MTSRTDDTAAQTLARDLLIYAPHRGAGAPGTDEEAAAARAADEAILVGRPTCELARRALIELVDAYNGGAYRLLRDLGDHLGLSLAYVDRETVEAHLERHLSNAEWTAVAGQFTALDFDDHVGDHGSFRTDWIESVLEQAGVPGYGYPDDSCSAATGSDNSVGGAA